MTKIFCYGQCPRCGDQSLESLKSYAYCVGCNYNSEEGLFPNKKSIYPFSENEAARATVENMEELDHGETLNAA